MHCVYLQSDITGLRRPSGADEAKWRSLLRWSHHAVHLIRLNTEVVASSQFLMTEWTEALRNIAGNAQRGGRRASQNKKPFGYVSIRADCGSSNMPMKLLYVNGSEESEADLASSILNLCWGRATVRELHMLVILLLEPQLGNKINFIYQNYTVVRSWEHQSKLNINTVLSMTVNISKEKENGPNIIHCII